MHIVAFVAGSWIEAIEFDSGFAGGDHSRVETVE